MSENSGDADKNDAAHFLTVLVGQSCPKLGKTTTVLGAF